MHIYNLALYKADRVKTFVDRLAQNSQQIICVGEKTKSVIVTHA